VAQLFVLSGSDVGRSFDVRPGDTIGRSPDCILVLKDASISRRHAHLEEAGGAWSVVDDGSRNGVVAEGTRVERAPLRDGQEFLLGEVLLRFRCEAVAEPAPAPPPPGPAPAPPPAPRPAPAARSPRSPAAEPTSADDGGLVLEGAEEIDLASAAPAPAAARAATREGLAEQRGRVLQYHRVPETGSALSFELAQLPAWQRYGLYLLALAVLAGATAAAFLGAAFVKERLTGGGTAPAAVETPGGDR